MALTERDCRTCGAKLTEDNARIYQGRWVGACRRCESLVAAARYYARKAVAD